MKRGGSTPDRSAGERSQASGIQPGDRLEFEFEFEFDVEGDRIVLRRLPASALYALAGFRGEIWQGEAGRLQAERDAWDS